MTARPWRPTRTPSGNTYGLWPEVTSALGGTAPACWYYGHIHNGIIYNPGKNAHGQPDACSDAWATARCRTATPGAWRDNPGGAIAYYYQTPNPSDPERRSPLQRVRDADAHRGRDRAGAVLPARPAGRGTRRSSSAARSPVREDEAGKEEVGLSSPTERLRVCPGRSLSPRQGAIGRSRGASAPRDRTAEPHTGSTHRSLPAATPPWRGCGREGDSISGKVGIASWPGGLTPPGYVLAPLSGLPGQTLSRAGKPDLRHTLPRPGYVGLTPSGCPCGACTTAAPSARESGWRGFPGGRG